MALSAFLLSFVGQELGTPVPHAQIDSSAPMVVAEPKRLAISPQLDGILSEEEWDPFADMGDSRTYLQWEPGKLHVAGLVPSGSDFLVSIDQGNNGWLRGKDNIEVRASVVADQVVLRARVLDNTRKEGPVWVDMPSFALGSKAAAKEGATSTFYELTLTDPAVDLNPQRGDKLSLRCDVVPTDSPDGAAFLPKALSEVSLVTQRSAGLPTGLTVNIQDGFQTVVPGENVRLRVTFRGSNMLQMKKIEMRSEGEAKDATLSLSSPFPFFDNKGRAFIDYDTRVASFATTGYRVMRGTLVAGDGLPCIVQGSYRVAPLVDFFLRKSTFGPSEATRPIRLFCGVRSNSVNKVSGNITVDLPTGWRNLSDADKGYVIGRKGYSYERYMDIEVPGGTMGTFPLKFRSNHGETQTEQTVWMTIR